MRSPQASTSVRSPITSIPGSEPGPQPLRVGGARRDRDRDRRARARRRGHLSAGPPPPASCSGRGDDLLLFDGRFRLGIGSGEALNEHILGHRWPPLDVRLAMLDEAIGIMRELWWGETVDHRGAYTSRTPGSSTRRPGRFRSRVRVRIELGRARGGLGDGLGITVRARNCRRLRGGRGIGPHYAELRLPRRRSTCCGQMVDRAWPIGAAPRGSPPGPAHLDPLRAGIGARGTARRRDPGVPCGPDPAPVLDAIRARLDAGYDHVYLHQIGPDQQALPRDVGSPPVAGTRGEQRWTFSWSWLVHRPTRGGVRLPEFHGPSTAHQTLSTTDFVGRAPMVVVAAAGVDEIERTWKTLDEQERSVPRSSRC